MSDYSELIAKLEGAPEGSREIDAFIWAEVDNRDVRWEGNRALAKSREAPYNECVLGTIVGPDGRKWFDSNSHHKPILPAYTTSLDAALTLVPERWHIASLRTGNKDCGHNNPKRYCGCSLQPNLNNDEGWAKGIQVAEWARTPALALCITALKARAAEESDT